ncbi:MAG: glycosyltransferase [Lachnospiraceae bacterium]|nr:glycosyltransferase [Lachnospiraceae bacterium]
MNKKIVIFCVNYNSYDSLGKYLESINRAYERVADQVRLQVVVADNSTKKEEMIFAYSFEVILLDTGSNLGYFGGIEYGIHHSGVNLSDCDYIIVSNVDLKISDDFFENLIPRNEIDSLGCIAPSIFSEADKRDRNPKILYRPGRKKLVLQRTFYQFPFLDYMYTHLFYAIRRKKVQNYPAGYIYAAHGSFIIFTNGFAGFLEKMDYPCFLFGEEIYLAEHLWKRGLKTYYDPNLKVYDSDHVSTGKMKSKAYYQYNYKSIDMLLKEYFNE